MSICFFHFSDRRFITDSVYRGYFPGIVELYLMMVIESYALCADIGCIFHYSALCTRLWAFGLLRTAFMTALLKSSRVMKSGMRMKVTRLWFLI